jgi:hypothetical protein
MEIKDRIHSKNSFYEEGHVDSMLHILCDEELLPWRFGWGWLMAGPALRLSYKHEWDYGEPHFPVGSWVQTQKERALVYNLSWLSRGKQDSQKAFLSWKKTLKPEGHFTTKHGMMAWDDGKGSWLSSKKVSLLRSAILPAGRGGDYRIWTYTPRYRIDEVSYFVEALYAYWLSLNLPHKPMLLCRDGLWFHCVAALWPEPLPLTWPLSPLCGWSYGLIDIEEAPYVRIFWPC